VFGSSPEAFDGSATGPSSSEVNDAKSHDGESAEQKQQDDEHEPVLYEDEKSCLKIVLAGIPDWRWPKWSLLTVGVNVLLALFTLDLVFRGPLLYPVRDLSFTRVGFVDSTSAKVLVREPDPAQLPLYVYLSTADTRATRWTTTDTIYYLGPDTDYTHAVTFDGLQSSQKYIYALSNDQSGVFTTAPSPSSHAADSLTFLTSSCLKANFPYRPWAHSLAIHGLGHLSKVVRSLPTRPAFMLFLGDFIYVDVPLRLSSSLRHYRAEYRRVYASPSWRLPGLDSLPWIHTLDDHEIANDWSGGNDTDPFPAASDPFIHYHVSVNPPVPPRSPTGPETNTTYFCFSQGPASIFMLDTRRYRTDPEPAAASSVSKSRPLYGSSAESAHPLPPPSNHSMLGAAQLGALLDFLATPEPPHVHWKIVASSVPFTKNWRFGTSDTWGGFLRERARILEAMHAAERDLRVRVVVLSGDRHEFAAIRFPPPIVDFAPAPVSETAAATNNKNVVYDRTPDVGPHEFSVGPLSMFYLPFRTFKQVDDEDVAIQYLPDGNSKVGVVELQNLRGKGPESALKYSLFVDGKLAWNYTLTSPSPAAGTGTGTRGWDWLLGRRGAGGRSWLWD
jgi:alkaline phosphatase D